MKALEDALASGDDSTLRAELLAVLLADEGRVVPFARAVGAIVTARPDPPVGALEKLLDSWAAGPDELLACAAVASYGEVGLVRPDWRDDEERKLRQAAADPRERVRRAASEALRRLR